MFNYQHNNANGDGFDKPEPDSTNGAEFELLPLAAPDSDSQFKQIARMGRPNFQTLARNIRNDMPLVAARMLACSQSYRRDRSIEYLGQKNSTKRPKPIFRCGHRFCPFCGRVRSFKCAEKIQSFIEELAHDGDDRTLFTATQDVREGESLEAACRRLGDSLVRFQRSVARKKGPDGRKAFGIGFVEIGGEPDRWNVHCHYIILRCPESRNDLLARWRKHSRGGTAHAKALPESSKTKAVDGSQDADTKRVVRYIAKGEQVDATYSDKDLERVKAIILGVPKNFKLLRSFGKPNVRTTGKKSTKPTKPTRRKRVSKTTTQAYSSLPKIPGIKPVTQADWIANGIQIFNQTRNPRLRPRLHDKPKPNDQPIDQGRPEDGPIIDGESSPEEGV